MNSSVFKCTVNTVRNLYGLFDNLVSKDKGILDTVLKKDSVEVVKDYLGDTIVKYKDSKYGLDSDVLGNLNADASFDDGGLVGSLFMLRNLEFNEGYLYDPIDVMRCSEDYGIVGYRKHYANTDNIFAPKPTIPFYDICEVRGEYKTYINNGYKKVNLPKEFLELCNNPKYKELFSKFMKKSYCVNRLFEHRGGVFCRNVVYGYASLDSLSGVESDFYNRLLEIVVGLGKPVHSAYFYSDLNWTCMLYRESKESKGEYDIVLK